MEDVQRVEQSLGLTTEQIVTLGLFNEAYYLRTYEDLRDSKGTGLEHFLLYGMQEARQPSVLFNPTDYVQIYPDVAVSSMLPFEHFCRFGMREHRFGSRDVKDLIMSGLFDVEYYLKHNADVATHGTNPLAHYLELGAFEQRQPCAEMNLAAFWRAFPHLTPGSINPVLTYARMPHS